MPDTLPSSWQTEAEKIHGSNPFAWCWDFQLQRNDLVNTHAWLVNYPEELSFTAPDFFGTPVARTFKPFPVTQSDVEQNNEGDLPQLLVQLSNQGRILAPYFETVDEPDGLVGSVAQAFLVHVNDLANYREHVFEVEHGSLTNERLELRLTAGSWLHRRVPQARFTQARCRFRFGTGTARHPSGCGYIINGAAAFTTCKRTIEDCEARGLDEAARGLPILHPEGFGGFLGVPEQ